MKVIDFLKKNNVFTNKIKEVDYHMNILNVDIDDLKRTFKEIKDYNDEELLSFLSDAFKKCDMANPLYDSNFDLEMTRLGLKTDKFYANEYLGSIENDDGYFNETSTNYDRLVDFENEVKHMK